MSKTEFHLSDRQRAQLALALSQMPADSGAHLSSEQFAQLVDHQASETELNAWKQHLRDCPSCYSLFLDVAQWRLEHAANAQKAEQPKSWLASLSSWIGEHRYATGTVAAVVMVSFVFYLVPVPQQQPLPVALPPPPSQPTIELQRAPEEAPAARATSPAPMVADSALSVDEEGKPAKPELEVQLDPLEFDRSAPDAPVPSVAEVINPAENFKAPVLPLEGFVPDESDKQAAEQLALNEEKEAERIEVTGSRIKAETERRERQAAHAATSTPAADRVAPTLDRQALADGYYGRSFKSETRTEYQPGQETIASVSFELGRWLKDVETFCQQGAVERSDSEFVRLKKQHSAIESEAKDQKLMLTFESQAIDSAENLCQQQSALRTELGLQ
ncbi:hypothetical protein [Permianibacter aggregans]|uniref:Uncharacterized protein n=1 Tax=Permianibacter aggregans TaxID=1510150 RepID=A0A4R6UQH1_9GAMM|nr:hypothetical protein [Permianibacter aggregans]QGX39996.1 hypothetical protein E2H98_10110 [Permianibacter aggregans]TDQ49192.1 hypothetical protein EV696_105166 [Permianibacter aggregans]